MIVKSFSLVVVLLLAMSIVLPFAGFYLGKRSKKRFKKSLLVNIISFFGILIVGTFLVFNKNIFAEPAQASQNIDSFTQGL